MNILLYTVSHAYGPGRYAVRPITGAEGNGRRLRIEGGVRVASCEKGAIRSKLYAGELRALPQLLNIISTSQPH